MGILSKGDLVYNTNLYSNNINKFGIFLSYGENAAYQKEIKLSKILLGAEVVLIPTAFLTMKLSEAK